MDVGGFKNPKQQREKQAEWDQQVAVSFLLDIDWSIPREIEEVRLLEMHEQKSVSNSKVSVVYPYQ